MSPLENSRSSGLKRAIASNDMAFPSTAYGCNGPGWIFPQRFSKKEDVDSLRQIMIDSSNRIPVRELGRYGCGSAAEAEKEDSASDRTDCMRDSLCADMEIKLACWLDNRAGRGEEGVIG